MKLRSFQKILALGIAVCLLLAGLVWFCMPNSQSLAKRIFGQIETAEDSELPALLNELADLDDVGLPLICDLLDHDRASVRIAAHREIGNLMASWRMLPGTESGPRVANLAALLAERVEGFSPFGKRAAVDIAAQLLRFEIATGDADNSKFAYHCESILLVAANIDAANMGQSLENETLASDAALASQATVSALESSVVAPPIPTSTDVEPVRPLFTTGTVEHGGFQTNEFEKPNFTQLQNDPNHNEGELEQQPMPENSPGVPAPFAPPSEPVQALSPRNDVSAIHSEGSPPDTARTDASIAEGIGTESAEPRAKLATANLPEDVHHDALIKQASLEESENDNEKTRSERELVADLSSPDAAVTSVALRELKRRGFSETQLDIAEQLASPDPLVRLGVVEHLPTVHGINARRWIIWMTYDTDTRIRDKAVAILATNDSMEVRVRFREMLAGESDPDIRRRLHYWLQSHR